MISSTIALVMCGFFLKKKNLGTEGTGLRNLSNKPITQVPYYFIFPTKFWIHLFSDFETP
jgi:hypothetical protein